MPQAAYGGYPYFTRIPAGFSRGNGCYQSNYLWGDVRELFLYNLVRIFINWQEPLFPPNNADPQHRWLGVPKAKLESKNYVNAFAEAVAAFSADRSEGINQVAETLVVSFDADAAELWLWDETSGSCYLTHSFGCNGRRRLDYAVAGSGVIGKIASSGKTIENIVLSTCGPDDHDFSHQTGLSHITGYPLRAQDSLMGVLAIYTRDEAPEELLTWWRLYADVSEARLSSELVAQQKDTQITQLSLRFEATRLLNSTLDLAE